MSEFIVQRRKKVIEIDPKLFSDETDKEIEEAEELVDKILNGTNRKIIPPVIVAEKTSEKKTTQKKSTKKKKSAENLEIHLEDIRINWKEIKCEISETTGSLHNWIFYVGHSKKSPRDSVVKEICEICNTILAKKLRELRRD